MMSITMLDVGKVKVVRRNVPGPIPVKLPAVNPKPSPTAIPAPNWPTKKPVGVPNIPSVPQGR